MLNSSQLKNAYNYLYEQMRKYIWNFDTVKLLAEIEVSCYTAFPNINELKYKCDRLQFAIKPIAQDDEDLQKSLDELVELLDSDSIFMKLDSVEEVIPDENFKDEQD